MSTQALQSTSPANFAEDAWLTMRETGATAKYSRASIYRLIKDEGFPKPHKAHRHGKVLFRAKEVADWLSNRPRALGG
jgi:predicted DNA-binding transcriptional regulator AlpA